MIIKTTNRKLLVGLEIGTSKISVIVGEILPDEMVNIIGIGNYPSHGMNQGEIHDLSSVVKSIKRSIDQSELMADCHISSVYLAISGKHINYQNEIGMVPISEDEVTQEDINNVVHTAKSVKIPDEHRVLHVIPQEYTIDNKDGIKNPIGLSGVRIKAKVHLITCHNDMAKNIIKAVEKCDLKIDQLIFSGLASSYSVLSEDERELGVCLVDIGGGTMDIMIYINGALHHIKVIPYAGNIVTRDIAYAFGISLIDAETLKIQHGYLSNNTSNNNDNIYTKIFNNYSSKHLPQHTLLEVIEPRYIELLNLVNNEIIQLQQQLQQQNIQLQLTAGIVLTGGGSQINGLIECAEKIFNTQVRIGKPLNITGLTEYVQNSSYSTVTGLLHYHKHTYSINNSGQNKNTFVKNWFHKIGNWLKKEF
uniref:Cell division protein FtsA n=1 Tax=Candidatus Aschnera chinzeii TaxID=1485666 RepID=A0AAT9G4M0_9ENTR|nr:MAG: cell division protein FtsA [Candidatus Aschnera chinzeii]